MEAGGRRGIAGWSNMVVEVVGGAGLTRPKMSKLVNTPEAPLWRVIHMGPLARAIKENATK